MLFSSEAPVFFRTQTELFENVHTFVVYLYSVLYFWMVFLAKAVLLV